MHTLTAAQAETVNHSPAGHINLFFFFFLMAHVAGGSAGRQHPQQCPRKRPQPTPPKPNLQQPRANVCQSVCTLYLKASSMVPLNGSQGSITTNQKQFPHGIATPWIFGQSSLLLPKDRGCFVFVFFFSFLHPGINTRPCVTSLVSQITF